MAKSTKPKSVRVEISVVDGKRSVKLPKPVLSKVAAFIELLGILEKAGIESVTPIKELLEKLLASLQA